MINPHQKTRYNLPSNFKFGIFFSIVFFTLFLIFFLYKLTFFTIYFAFLAVILIILSFLKPDSLKQFNKLWFLFGITIGKFISPIILSLMFFLLISPLAILMKLFKRDELKLKFHNKKSYWATSDNVNSFERFKNQF